MNSIQRIAERMNKLYKSSPFVDGIDQMPQSAEIYLVKVVSVVEPPNNIGALGVVIDLIK